MPFATKFFLKIINSFDFHGNKLDIDSNWGVIISGAYFETVQYFSSKMGGYIKQYLDVVPFAI